MAARAWRRRRAGKNWKRALRFIEEHPFHVFILPSNHAMIAGLGAYHLSHDLDRFDDYEPQPMLFGYPTFIARAKRDA